MKRREILRRSSEILAAAIIIGSIILYTITMVAGNPDNFENNTVSASIGEGIRPQDIKTAENQAPPENHDHIAPLENTEQTLPIGNLDHRSALDEKEPVNSKLPDTDTGVDQTDASEEEVTPETSALFAEDIPEIAESGSKASEAVHTISEEPIYKYVHVDKLNVRIGPGSETERLTTLQRGDRVEFLGKDGEWLRIRTDDKICGYVFSKYVAAEKIRASRSVSGGTSYDSDLASKLIEYAKSFTSVKYVYGGETPDGFDCSGFTRYVFKHIDIKLPRSAAEYEDVGTKVSRSELKPGDVLLFDAYNSCVLDHVGIYIGDGRFIHASASKGEVVVVTLSKYGGNLLGIRRVIQ